MHLKYKKDTGEMLAALYKTGFNKQTCSVCNCDYILATKTKNNLKLTCRKCGDVRLFSTDVIFNKK